MLFWAFLVLVSGAVVVGESVKDYAPQTNVKCPDVDKTPLIRVFTPQSQKLNEEEEAYVREREHTVAKDAWADWVGDGSALGYKIEDFGGNFSRVGIAISGGGYRAAQYGAGVLSGLDARNDSSKAAGTGGLLQVASYISGLSGGSWLTGSLFLNNFPTIKDVVYGNGKDLSGWMLDLDLATPDGLNLFNDNNQAFYGSLLWSVIAKANAGIDTSLTDPWARMISYHFLNQTSRSNFFTNDSAHGAGQLWSKIPNIEAWQKFSTPFPLICADSRPVGSNLTTSLGPEPVVYEITPLEFGSWDPNLSAMANLSWVGTHLKEGKPDNDTACVTGFDQAGFVMGTSASLFNQILDFGRNFLYDFGEEEGGGAGLIYVLSRQLRSVRTRADDVANWPNPFNGLKKDTFEDSDSRWLELIDGASNNENIPLGTQFVKARALDVVLAVDSSANTETRWPNGTSVLFSARRMSTILQASHQHFPPIPEDAEGFIETGVNMRPTFFGCDPVVLPPEYPIVIYFPNSPPFDGATPVANTKTFKLQYTPKHTQMFLDQVHNNTLAGFKPGTTEADPNFGKCLQCAALDRARMRISGKNVTRSEFCQTCFKQYCYDARNPPSKNDLPGRTYEFVDPEPQGASKVKGFFSTNKGGLIGGFLGLFAVVGVLTGGLLWWKKRKSRNAAYTRVNELHDDDIKSAPWQNYSSSAQDGRYNSTYELYPTR